MEKDSQGSFFETERDLKVCLYRADPERYFKDASQEQDPLAALFAAIWAGELRCFFLRSKEETRSEESRTCPLSLRR